MTAAIVVGVQITIARDHSDSEANFFSDWQWWKSILDCPDVTFRFLWILKNVGSYDPEDVGPNYRITRNGTHVTHPAFKRTRVAVRDINHDIGTMLADARASKAL